MKKLDTLSPNSRVWIYQSSRLLSNEEVTTITNRARLFINEWTSHGSLMDAVVEVLYNSFVVICVDESTVQASGCGIDKSIRFIQEMEKELGISLLERTNVAYRDKDMKIKICSINDFEKLVHDGLVNENTIVFNNLITNKSELLSTWEVPAKESWHRRYLKLQFN